MGGKSVGLFCVKQKLLWPFFTIEKSIGSLGWNEQEKGALFQEIVPPQVPFPQKKGRERVVALCLHFQRL